MTSFRREAYKYILNRLGVDLNNLDEFYQREDYCVWGTEPYDYDPSGVFWYLFDKKKTVLKKRSIGWETIDNFFTAKDEPNEEPAKIVLCSIGSKYCTYIEHSSVECPWNNVKAEEFRVYTTLEAAEEDYNSCCEGISEQTSLIKNYKYLDNLQTKTHLCVYLCGYKGGEQYYSVWAGEDLEVTLVEDALSLSEAELRILDDWYFKLSERMQEAGLELYSIEFDTPNKNCLATVYSGAEERQFEINVPRSFSQARTYNIMELTDIDTLVNTAIHQFS